MKWNKRWRANTYPNDTIHHSHYAVKKKFIRSSRSSHRKFSAKKMLLKTLQIFEYLKACNFISKKLQHCELYKSAFYEEYLRLTASVYLKSKLQIMQFTYKLKTFNFRIYKAFSYFLSFENFSSTKFLFAFELLSLNIVMYIVSAKTYYFCMFVCFAFMYALLSCLHTWMLSSDIKRAHRQNIWKHNSISNVRKIT